MFVWGYWRRPDVLFRVLGMCAGSRGDVGGVVRRDARGYYSEGVSRDMQYRSNKCLPGVYRLRVTSKTRRGAVAHAGARVAEEARVCGTDDGSLEGCYDSCPFRDHCISNALHAMHHALAAHC